MERADAAPFPRESRLMHNAAFVVATASVLLTGLVVAVRLRLPSRLDALLAWGLLCAAEVVALVVLLGWVGALRTGWLLVGSLAVLGIVGLAVRGPAFTSARMETRAEFRALRADLTWKNIRNVPLAAFLAVLAIGQVTWSRIRGLGASADGVGHPDVPHARGRVLGAARSDRRHPLRDLHQRLPYEREATFAWPAVLLPFGRAREPRTAPVRPPRRGGDGRHRARDRCPSIRRASSPRASSSCPRWWRNRWRCPRRPGSCRRVSRRVRLPPARTQSLGLLQGGSDSQRSRDWPSSTWCSRASPPGSAWGARRSGLRTWACWRSSSPGCSSRRVGSELLRPAPAFRSRRRGRRSRPAARHLLVRAQRRRAPEPALSLECRSRRRGAPARPAGRSHVRVIVARNQVRPRSKT